MRIIINKRSRLAYIRFTRGYSLKKLSEISNVNPATILRLEKGLTNPNPATAKAICDALGVAVDDVFKLMED